MIYKILSAGCLITLFSLLQGPTVSAQSAAPLSSYLSLTLTQPDTGFNSPLTSDELFKQQQRQWNQQNEQMRQQQSEQLRQQQDLQLEQNNLRQQQQIEQQQKLNLPNFGSN